MLLSPESAVRWQYQSWEDYELRATGYHGTSVSRDGVRSQLPNRDSCSPALSISVYFLLKMRLLQMNLDWSELKLFKHLKRLPGLHKTFYFLRTYFTVCTPLSEVTLPPHKGSSSRHVSKISKARGC